MAGDEERLIVLIEARLDKFEKEMRRAERAGTSTYARMQKDAFKATTAIEAQLLASAKAQGRALESVFGQNVDRAGKSARDSAAAFKEFDKARASVDALRASFDPIFAASKRYEGAIEELDRALRLGVISQEEHARAVKQAETAYLGAGSAADGMGGGLLRLGNLSGQARAQVQNFGFQVQDLAVQIAGGTDASRAMAQQLPQLLSGFGLVGVAAGTLAAVGLPLVTAWFGNGEAAARSFDTALGQVENSLAAMNERAAIYTAEGLAGLKEKYGEVNGELLAFIDLQTQAMQRQAIEDVQAAMGALRGETEAWMQSFDVTLMHVFETGILQARGLEDALRRAEEAATFEEQLAAVQDLRRQILDLTGGIDNMTQEQAAFYRKVLDSEDALRQLAAAAPKAGWLSGLIGQAQTLASELWGAVKARAALDDAPVQGRGDPRGFVQDEYWKGRYMPAPDNGKPGRTGGGSSKAGKSPGGGGGDAGTGRIDSLLRDLQTEREIVAAWYQESLETLNLATEAQLAAVGGKHEALERLEAEHQERLRGIRDQSNTGALAQAETFFGALATVTAAGGDRLSKISRAFAAAEALINTYRAQAQVLADPKLGFWAKLPAVAAIGAAGMRLVSSLGGSGRSSSAGSSSAGAATGQASASETAQARPPVVVTLQNISPKDLYQGQVLIDFVAALRKEFGNQGIILGASQ